MPLAASYLEAISQAFSIRTAHSTFPLPLANASAPAAKGEAVKTLQENGS